jgi:hypothetical protein
MKTRQILIAAATSLVVASPAFAAAGSYGEGSMWTDLARDVAEYSNQSFANAPSGGVQLASEIGIYEQLAAAQRKSQSEQAEGLAGPAGPTIAVAEVRTTTFELRNDASIYEQVAVAQRNMGHF